MTSTVPTPETMERVEHLLTALTAAIIGSSYEFVETTYPLSSVEVAMLRALFESHQGFSFDKPTEGSEWFIPIARQAKEAAFQLVVNIGEQLASQVVDNVAALSD
jgi:hypothetical protein